MTDPPDPLGDEDAAVPRWVKVSAIIGILLVLLFAALHLLSGGRHGPGRHAHSDDAAGPLAAVAVAEPLLPGAPAPGAERHG